jgi:hypothetical protein
MAGDPWILFSKDPWLGLELGSFHVKSTNGPHHTISEFDEILPVCKPTYLRKLCKILAQNVARSSRYDHFYSGGVATARERLNSEAFLITNISGSMIDTSIKFSQH